jgi:ribosomal protein L40E
MTVPAQPAGHGAEAQAPHACPLCGATVPHGTTRCRSCGLYQQLGARVPNPFTRASLWTLAGLLLAVYVVCLVIVSLAK